MREMPPHAVPPRDPGLQPERTDLAWRRTLLALIVADFFIWRAWLVSTLPESRREDPAVFGLGLAACAAAAATVLIAGCVLSRARAMRAANTAPPAALLRTAAGSMTLLAAAIIACTVLSP
jgi:uncharacterized membrane protein YidH (DUF202 family)